MQMKGRTLAALLGITVIVSSLLTYAATDSEKGFLQGFLGQIGPEKENRTNSNPQDAEQAANLKKVYEIYGLIQDNYLEDVDQQKLIDGAINGMINALDDPYTVYMDPKSAEQFNQSISSSFQGIGAEVTMEGGKVTIVSPFKGSPAEKAGLRPKDQIISVNGETLEGLDLYQAVLKIRGPKGSEAELSVLRPGISDPLTVTVVRDDIPLETVYTETIQRDGHTFGKIEVAQFSTDTAAHFKEQLEKMEQQQVDGLIIDLRGDPGGLLPAVVEMSQMLLPKDQPILQLEDPEGNREVVKSTIDGKKNYPITVLVDKGSASASEIMAAALKENGYKLVGQHTFGKGTVQNTVELGDKSQVKMTIAKWLTPSGEWIHKKGIEPNIPIEQPKYFLAAPIDVKKGSLQFDQNNEAVKNLQVILDGLGFPPGRSDGYFDQKTETAVKAFQKLNNLPMTGKVDQKTAQLMQDHLIKKIQEPANDLQLQAAIQVLLEQVKK